MRIRSPERMASLKAVARQQSRFGARAYHHPARGVRATGTNKSTAPKQVASAADTKDNHR